MKGVMDHTTTVIAVGGITSPYWLHILDGASNIAGDLIPIFGALWLLIKIVAYFKNGRLD